MANEQSGVKFFVILTILAGIASTGLATATDEEEESPLMEIAQSLLRDSLRSQKGGSGLSLLGGLVQGFMQTEGGRQIGEMLSDKGGGAGGVAEMLSNLAAVWKGAKTEGDSAKEESSFDPSILGSVIDLLGTIGKAAGDSGNRIPDNGREVAAGHENGEEASVDWETLLNFAGSIMSSMGREKGRSESGSGLESVMSFLPVLLNSLAGQHNVHASKSIPHHSHEQFLPPFLENLHEYWDHFSNSDFGKALWENSGLSRTAKLFTDRNGNFEVDKVFGSLENNSFRRMWIKGISNFVAQWLKHFTDPHVQGRYMETIQVVCNGFLAAQGYPRSVQVDLDRPAESISDLANAVFMKQFNLKVDSQVYVKPAISYIQELFKMAQRKGLGVSKLSTQDIESKLAETLDAEVIEPILRVNRAYKFGMSKKACAKYVICAINQQGQDGGKSGLKPGITKLASLGASWFLSGNLDIPFWLLYGAVVEGKGCAEYDQTCSEFHSQDLKATTEYFHNEL